MIAQDREGSLKRPYEEKALGPRAIYCIGRTDGRKIPGHKRAEHGVAIRE